jgi:hypothetical protein
MKKIPEDYHLYCLMRNDLDSLNAGKAMAQAMHAQAMASQMLDEVGKTCHPHATAWEGWKAQTKQGFGTTIVLGANMGQIERALHVFSAAGLANGLVHDPTYPLMDGQVLHLIPVDTCAWVFGPAHLVSTLTMGLGLELHP